jgi:hypothetical protein
MVGLLMHVQTASLTWLSSIAFAQFAWDFVSILDRVELKAYNMFNCVYDPLTSISDY